MVANFINNGIVYHCDSLYNNKIFALLSLPITLLLLSIEYWDQPCRERRTYAYHILHRNHLEFFYAINKFSQFIAQQRKSKINRKWEKRKRRWEDSKTALIIQYFIKVDSCSEWTKSQSQITPHKMICQIENWFIFVLNWNDKTKSVRFFSPSHSMEFRVSHWFRRCLKYKYVS